MQDLRLTDDRVRIIRFARNTGQHHAILCGLQRAHGEYVITLDDDLQNPPEAIPRFLAKVDEGYELVIGEIVGDKLHGGSRNLASRLVQRLVGRILNKPKDLYLSSYRCMTQRTARSLAGFTGVHVYLPALMLASVPPELICNIPVESPPRLKGRSQYTMRKLVKLTSYLLINHSYLPLRFVSGWGFLFPLQVLVRDLCRGGSTIFRNGGLGLSDPRPAAVVPVWQHLVVHWDPRRVRRPPGRGELPPTTVPDL